MPKSKELVNLRDRPIMDYFPGTPRPIQKEVLETIQKNWDKYDVFALVIPTGGGKSAIAMTLARWAFFCDITVPTNILLEQYLRDYPDFPHLKRRDLYPCCAKHKLGSNIGKHTPCIYVNARRKTMAMGRGLFNNYMYMALNNQKRNAAPILAMDEAHNLAGMIQDLNGYTMWKHEWHYPDNINGTAGFVQWAKNKKSISTLDNSEKAFYNELITNLTSRSPKYIFQRTMKEWRKTKVPEMRECILWKPVDITNPQITPIRVGTKLILMSATFSKKDLENLGLTRKKHLIIQGNSPIPAANRPIYVRPVASLSYNTLWEGTEKIADYIKEVLLPKHEGEKGVIHATYAQAAILRKFLGDDKRFIWHTSNDKTARYKQFLAASTDSGAVLVASGLYEGIDLPDDLGRWQVVAKVPWMSLSDPAIKYKAELDRNWYLWETAKIIIQACGRVSRHEKDHGVTYILDGTFSRLAKDLQNSLPEWFQEAIVIESETSK